MPAASISRDRRELRSTVAAIARHHGPDDPRLPELRRELSRRRFTAQLSRITDPTLAARIAEAARARAAEILAEGPIDQAVVDEVRRLVGPVPKAATATAIDAA